MHSKTFFNADETGLYFRALPQKSMTIKNNRKEGCKKAKERITILLGASALGEKLKPLVVGKSKSPHCFKSSKNLPVTYRWNKKSWMTSDIFKEYVTMVDRKLKHEQRKIIMFVDNCSAHPFIELENTKLVFLPPNTSHLQPRDAGIIQNVKLNYRKKLLQHLLFNIENCENAIELGKKSLLDAIYFLNYSWNTVKTETIKKKCFEKCGLIQSSAD